MTKLRISIGRAPECDIIVKESYDTVSSNHADIEMQNGILVFHDHSTNGTIINGYKIHNTYVEIYPDDVIMLAGKFELSWDEIINFFPEAKGSIKTNDAEEVPVGRKTVIQNSSEKSVNISSRATEQFKFSQHSSMQQRTDVTSKNNDNYGVENTYSQAEIDKEIDRWDWGGFLCSWIWAAYHKMYWPLIIVLIGCIPYLGQVASLVLSVYLGFTGSKKAWYSGKYDNFESYKSAKKRWIFAGCIIFIVRVITELYILYRLLTLI